MNYYFVYKVISIQLAKSNIQTKNVATIIFHIQVFIKIPDCCEIKYASR